MKGIVMNSGMPIGEVAIIISSIFLVISIAVKQWELHEKNYARFLNSK